MALTPEEMKVQTKVLTENTSSNTEMVFKTNKMFNKGLNPDYFSGADSRVVNALNKVYALAEESTTNGKALGTKLDNVILDVGTSYGAEKWQNLVDKITAINDNADTLIEMLELLFNGATEQEVLSLTEDDIGKVLTVVKDEVTGRLVTEAKEMTGGGSTGPISADKVEYTNIAHENITTVAGALDYLFTNAPSGPISWNDVLDKPKIVDNISLTDTALQMSDGSDVISSIPLVTNADIDNIISNL